MCEIIVKWVAYSFLHGLFAAALNSRSLPFSLG